MGSGGVSRDDAHLGVGHGHDWMWMCVISRTKMWKVKTMKMVEIRKKILQDDMIPMPVHGHDNNAQTCPSSVEVI